MALGELLKKVERSEKLLPALRKFLQDESEKASKGVISSKQGAIVDANLTIAAMHDRIKEYNHGEISDVEYFHPSALGKCMRQLWFRRMGAFDGGIKGVDVLRPYLISETGTYTHIIFQNLCKRAGFLISRETAIIDKGKRILGHADGIVEIFGRKALLEIKTINGAWFAKLERPEMGHIWQVHAYMKCLGLDEAIIIYLEKDRHGAKEFDVPFDQTIYDTYVKGRIHTFFKHVNDRSLPDREGDNPNTLPCRWCEFQRTCFDPKELKKFLTEVENNENTPQFRIKPKIRIKFRRIKLRK